MSKSESSSGPKAAVLVETAAEGKVVSSAAFAESSSERLGWVSLLSIFILAVLIRLAYNYGLPHVNNFASCDAFEYIKNAQALIGFFGQSPAFWQEAFNCLSGSASADNLHLLKAGMEPLKDFYISGPVFPAFLALIIAMVKGATADAQSLWMPLLLGNSLVSAATVVFIALLAGQCFGRKTALIAALLAAFYPGFIVNSGRLYSETFAAFLLVMLSYIGLRGFKPGANSFAWVFASGFLAAALQLTRSVMVVLSLAFLPLTAIQQKGFRRLTFILPFALGFSLIAAPWLAFQKLAFGGGGLVVDRVGHYNFFIGNNIDTQGWLSYPYPDGRNVESTSFPKLLQNAVEKSPQRWLRLMLDKPLRLFKYPWNDFRTAIGPFDFKWQVIFHEAVLLLSLLGLGLGLFLSRKEPSAQQLAGRLCLASLFAFHCIYYLFITVPRYNLTAIPEMIIFAAAAISMLFQQLEDPEKRKAALALIASAGILFFSLRTDFVPYIATTGCSFDFAIVLQSAFRVLTLISLAYGLFRFQAGLSGFKLPARITSAALFLSFLPLLALPLRANGRPGEWHQDISISSAPVRQNIHLPIASLEKGASGFYLLIDTGAVKQNADGLAVSVNGRRLQGPVLASMSLAENFERFLPLGGNRVQREGERMWDSLTSSAACSNVDLRQWSMLALPGDLLSAALERAKQESRDYLNLDVLLQNHNQEALRLFGTYSSNRKERLIPSVADYSWEKVFYGVENAEGLTDTRYDIKVPSATLPSTGKDLSDQAGLQNGSYNMAVLAMPPVLPAHEHAGASGDASLPSASRRLLAVDILKEKLLLKDKLSLDPVSLTAIQAHSDSVLFLHVKGRSRASTKDVLASAELECRYKKADGQILSFVSSWLPRRLASSSEWRDFEFVIPAKPELEGAKLSSCVLHFQRVSPEPPYLNIEKAASGELELAEVAMELLEVPTNPIGLGHRVY
ncbi:MAG: glycosyltransferase family 39 protein [Candidatus Obscuribacterales bacterium]|nr:glycosyltransferase family 39 protein [Candidatus Obscuribacterales bacterium]